MKHDVILSEDEDRRADQWFFAKDHVARLGRQYGDLIRLGWTDSADRIKWAVDYFLDTFSSLPPPQYCTLRNSLMFTFKVESEHTFDSGTGVASVEDIRALSEVSGQRVPHSRTPPEAREDFPRIPMQHL